MPKLYGYSTEEGEGYRTKGGRYWFDTTAQGVEFDGQTCFMCGCSIEEDQRVWVLPPNDEYRMYTSRYACHHHADIVARPDGTRPLG